VFRSHLEAASVWAERRLRIANRCEREAIWIARETFADGGSDGVIEAGPGILVEPRATVALDTLPSQDRIRYWPRLGCDAHGAHCTVGSGSEASSAPQVDTKFEAIFNSSGSDFIDVNLIGGWSLPFSLRLANGGCEGQEGDLHSPLLDCSGLTLEACPREEDVLAASASTDLRATSPATGDVVGCFSPCQRLREESLRSSASAARRRAIDMEMARHCCHAEGVAENCYTGPMAASAFARTVHARCPGVNSFAGDDGIGMLRCSPHTVYELSFFCPDTTATSGASAPSAALAMRTAAAPALAATATPPTPEQRRILPLSGVESPVPMQNPPDCDDSDVSGAPCSVSLGSASMAWAGAALKQYAARPIKHSPPRRGLFAASAIAALGASLGAALAATVLIKVLFPQRCAECAEGSPIDADTVPLLPLAFPVHQDADCFEHFDRAL